MKISPAISINKKCHQPSAISCLQMRMRAPQTAIQWMLPSLMVIAEDPGKCKKQPAIYHSLRWTRKQDLAPDSWRLHFHFSLSCIGEGNGNPLQCSCLENPRDGGAWWAATYGIAQSRTQLKQLSSSSSWGAYERNEFSEPTGLHLLIHRMLNSLTSYRCLTFRLPAPFVANLCIAWLTLLAPLEQFSQRYWDAVSWVRVLNISTK